ncbi:MAG: glycine--tRNA ligase subunit beta, partial [Gammaproteobacteria bacterium]|nr:glycine--tRNA ligase subunit beta [Gammaproteobacteria bacterium]
MLVDLMMNITSVSKPLSKSLLVELGIEELPPTSVYALGLEFASILANYLYEAEWIVDDPHHPNAIPAVSSQSKFPKAYFGEFFATPRRLAVLIHGVLAEGKPQVRRLKLMPLHVAYHQSDGRYPTPSLLKKLASLGISTDTGRSSWEENLEIAEDFVYYHLKTPGLHLSTAITQALAL